MANGEVVFGRLLGHLNLLFFGNGFMFVVDYGSLLSRGLCGWFAGRWSDSWALFRGFIFGATSGSNYTHWRSNINYTPWLKFRLLINNHRSYVKQRAMAQVGSVIEEYRVSIHSGLGKLSSWGGEVGAKSHCVFHWFQYLSNSIVSQFQIADMIFSYRLERQVIKGGLDDLEL